MQPPSINIMWDIVSIWPTDYTDHDNSGSKYAKKTHDWKTVYTEIFMTKSEAMRRELEIKKKKSKSYIEWLISSVRKSVPMAIGKVVGSTPIFSTNSTIPDERGGSV